MHMKWQEMHDVLYRLILSSIVTAPTKTRNLWIRNTVIKKTNEYWIKEPVYQFGASLCMHYFPWPDSLYMFLSRRCTGCKSIHFCATPALLQLIMQCVLLVCAANCWRILLCCALINCFVFIISLLFYCVLFSALQCANVYGSLSVLTARKQWNSELQTVVI